MGLLRQQEFTAWGGPHGVRVGLEDKKKIEIKYEAHQFADSAIRGDGGFVASVLLRRRGSHGVKVFVDNAIRGDGRVRRDGATTIKLQWCASGVASCGALPDLGELYDVKSEELRLMLREWV
ncbi:hypothetical protein L1049_012457 [Liquidambar formosana]|uniref:Uncharacterized protein n=1 Tax=Liquidambar formosana TaxID=63359 RepID=A0AAP0N475_LIQFO